MWHAARRREFGLRTEGQPWVRCHRRPFNRDAEGSAAVRLANRVNDDRQPPTPSETCEDSLLADTARRQSSLSRVGYE